jgi:hypothetical protein
MTVSDLQLHEHFIYSKQPAISTSEVLTQAFVQTTIASHNNITTPHSPKWNTPYGP